MSSTDLNSTTQQLIHPRSTEPQNIASDVERWLDSGDHDQRSQWEKYFRALGQVHSESMVVGHRGDSSISASACLGQWIGGARSNPAQMIPWLWKLLVLLAGRTSYDTIDLSQGKPLLNEAAVQSLIEKVPDVAVLQDMDRELDSLLVSLRNDQLRSIAIAHLQGATQLEIAQRLGVARFSVERKLRLIRNRCHRLLSSAVHE